MTKIWIDVDNLPHVTLFRPVIQRLLENRIEIILTVRDFAFSVERLQDLGIQHLVVGRHYGRSKYRKILGTLWRAVQLYRILRKLKPDIALSHSSRSAIIAARMLRLNSVTMFDYEHVSTTLQERLADHILVPEKLLDDSAHGGRKYIGYPGFKEEIYLAEFAPEPGFRDALEIPTGLPLILFRPPATEAHYHNPEAEHLEQLLIDRLIHAGTFTIVLPRNQSQADVYSQLPADRFRVLERPLCGLNLMNAAAIVISGGGTMNREAAIHGIPVYSFFQGESGILDRVLNNNQRLEFINNEQEINNIPLEQLPSRKDSIASSATIEYICTFLMRLAKTEGVMR